MRLFQILNKDGSVLLEGVEFEDGQTVAQFRGENGSLCIFDDVEQLQFFHAQKKNNRTFRWMSEPLEYVSDDHLERALEARRRRAGVLP